MTLEEEILIEIQKDHPGMVIKPSPLQRNEDTELYHAWFIMEIDEKLTPRLETRKIEALTSYSNLIRERAKILLEDYEFTLKLYKARNGLPWN